MRKKRIVLVLIVLLLIPAVILISCSKKGGPTDADIVKAAIQRAVSENCNILTPSIKVLSRTVNTDSASVTIGYVCGGLASSGLQRQMTLQMAASKDSSGRLIWTAR